MIDNVLDYNIVTRRRNIGYNTQKITARLNPLIGVDEITKDSTGIHVTPIRRSKGGKNSSHTTKLICKIFSFKTTNQCSEYEPTYQIFSGRSGRDCFVNIFEEEHE